MSGRIQVCPLCPAATTTTLCTATCTNLPTVLINPPICCQDPTVSHHVSCIHNYSHKVQVKVKEKVKQGLTALGRFQFCCQNPFPVIDDYFDLSPSNTSSSSSSRSSRSSSSTRALVLSPAVPRPLGQVYTTTAIRINYRKPENWFINT